MLVWKSKTIETTNQIEHPANTTKKPTLNQVKHHEYHMKALKSTDVFDVFPPSQPPSTSAPARNGHRTSRGSVASASAASLETGAAQSEGAPPSTRWWMVRNLKLVL